MDSEAGINETKRLFENWLNSIQAKQRVLIDSISEFARESLPSDTETFHIYGFTPNWNDGEECLHRMNCFINDWHGGEPAPWIDEDGLDESVFKRHFWSKELHNHIKSFEREFSAELQEAFGTNWLLCWRRSDGKEAVSIISRPPSY